MKELLLAAAARGKGQVSSDEAKPRCVNGCDSPVSPPSKVICKDCQDRITRKLEKWAADPFKEG